MNYEKGAKRTLRIHGRAISENEKPPGSPETADAPMERSETRAFPLCRYEGGLHRGTRRIHLPIIRKSSDESYHEQAFWLRHPPAPPSREKLPSGTHGTGHAFTAAGQHGVLTRFPLIVRRPCRRALMTYYEILHQKFNSYPLSLLSAKHPALSRRFPSFFQTSAKTSGDMRHTGGRIQVPLR